MYILGIHDGHLATAALAKDGEIIACVSEERFTGVKNQAGIPAQSIKYCLDFANLKPDKVDLVVFGGKLLPPTNANKSVNSRVYSFIYTPFKQLLTLERKVSTNISFLRNFEDFLYFRLINYFSPFVQKQRINSLKKYFNFDSKKIVFLDHHLSHAYSVLYSSGFPDRKKPLLVFTCDGEGDGLSATVNIWRNKRLLTISKTSMTNSLGNFYRSITKYLGMKPLEHEYKVMGLAPYVGNEDKKANEIYDKLKLLFEVDEKNLRIKTKVNSQLFKLGYLDKVLAPYRFDYVAYAAQRITEEVLARWVKVVINKTNIHDVLLSGGVFMNVKANQKIAKLKEVKNIFIMPSCGDESNAIGAAYWGNLLINQPPKALKNLYLGPDFEEKEIERAINLHSGIKFWQVKKSRNINMEIAKLLATGNIVARCWGRQEWGARALGNRSILADPSKLELVQIINKMIKSRDFWMPFASTIIDVEKERYVKNPKKINAPFMIITFDTTEEGKKDLRAAIHQYDKTTRPQILERSVNPEYYEILEEFKKLTGRGAILNTSFNLHGYPIVSGPKEALDTFAKSGLLFLALGDYLIQKK